MARGNKVLKHIFVILSVRVVRYWIIRHKLDSQDFRRSTLLESSKKKVDETENDPKKIFFDTHASKRFPNLFFFSFRSFIIIGKSLCRA